ncbi:PREDICTED: homocysteine S-methyltransferase-like [Priapulus caudatus]|uniref:Homocysteine S-methyltransferase-like n=1 Tax=Priapulus caudatus TaxID=37621 RepID=A0ABM1E6C4_PRICU|nr:PREDICTED: homocysteine S-methyltransferase-like [Priapulus caudatus]
MQYKLLIRDISRFLESGANVITTCTYQASIEGFCQNLLISPEESLELIKRGVKLAQSARTMYMQQNPDVMQCPLVAGSVGPYGASQHDGSEYSGNYVEDMSIKELKDWHRPRVRALLDARVDLLACESIPALKEAQALIELLCEFPHAKAWVSFTCKDGCHTSHGDSFAAAFNICMQYDQVAAVGINCTQPKYISLLLTSVSDLPPCKPIIVYPNSGEDWQAQKGWSGRGSCIPLDHYVEDWVNLGARWIGGCCRVTPCDITAIRQVVDKLRDKRKTA